MTHNVGGNIFAALAFLFFDDAKICLAARKMFRPHENLGKTNLGRRDRFRPKIAKIGAILAIFGLFEVSALESTLESTLVSTLISIYRLCYSTLSLDG